MGNREENRRTFIRYFAVYGCVSTGVIYTAVGVIALLALFRLREGGADENSFLAFLEGFLLGQILVWLILLGMLSYFAWRIYEAIKDPYKYGSDWIGVGRRIGIGLSSLADAVIAYSATMVLLGSSEASEDGNPEEQRQMVGSMLQEDWGDWMVTGLGIVVGITAIVQFYYGMTQGYRERLDIAHFNRIKKKLIHLLARIGYAARGIILGIIGFFFIRAGFAEDPAYVVNTDKAFNFIGENIGNVAFILVAAGTICYGFFMFSLGVTYDMDNDPSDPNFEKPEG